MAKKPFVFFIIFIYFLSACNRPSLERDPELDLIEKNFFDLFQKDPTSAVDDLSSTNIWFDKDEISSIKLKMDTLAKQLGKYHGYELIAIKGMGKNFTLHSFLAKYERQPVRFTFIYYRPGDKWQLQNFQFDYEFDSELVEAAHAPQLNQNLLYEDH